MPQEPTTQWMEGSLPCASSNRLAGTPWCSNGPVPQTGPKNSTTPQVYGLFAPATSCRIRLQRCSTSTTLAVPESLELIDFTARPAEVLTIRPTTFSTDPPFLQCRPPGTDHNWSAPIKKWLAFATVFPVASKIGNKKSVSLDEFHGSMSFI